MTNKEQRKRSTETSDITPSQLARQPEANGLPAAVTRRGIDVAQWNTLCQSLYPGASPASVVLVIDYCKARGLDPMKKPCHIVPMEVKDSRTNRYEWRDVVMPGIYELRITAHRTGLYGGHSKPEYGPIAEMLGVNAPEWCEITFYRLRGPASSLPPIEYPVRVYFREVVATKIDGGQVKANARWRRAPVQMLTKCAEAAGLREAFPDAIGGEQTAEEMVGQRSAELDMETTVTVERPPTREKPKSFDAWYEALQAVADEGWDALERCWQDSALELREYLNETNRDAWEMVKNRAMQATDNAADAGKVEDIDEAMPTVGREQEAGLPLDGE